MDEPTKFQQHVMAGVAATVQRHGGDLTAFTYDDRGKGYYAASATVADRRYDFEVYDRAAYAQVGQSRYESGVFDHPTEAAEADDFVRRFDRLLSSGSWFGREDPSLAESIAGTVKRLFRRK